MAKVNVGAATESEMKEKKARVEDALHATRAAVEEGILPGGGVALLRASSSVKAEGLTHDQEVGYNIILRACPCSADDDRLERRPRRRHCVREGHRGQGKLGYNAATDIYEDLVKAGIIDPTKVTRTALQNAASVATLLLTSDALIAEKPKEKRQEGWRPATAATTTCTNAAERIAPAIRTKTGPGDSYESPGPVVLGTQQISRAAIRLSATGQPLA